MALKDDKANEYINELVKAGILSGNDKNRLEFEEGYNDEGFSVEDIRTLVPETSLRASDWQTFQAISVGAGLKEPVRGVSDFSKVTSTGMPNINAPINQLVGAAASGLNWAWERLKEADGEDFLEGGKQTRRDIQRELEKSGQNVNISELYRYNNLEDLVEGLSNRYDIAPDVIAQVVENANQAGIARKVKTKQTETKLADEEKVDRTNEENPLYAKNLAAFEILDGAAPTKYQFDMETGAIYMTETGQQVDRKGKLLSETDLEAGANLVGGWPEGFIPQWEPNPEGTGWGKLSAQAGVVVDEYAYNDILDVIENKEWYGADPARYISGQANFLGGFDSTYQVKVEETDVMKRTRATAETFGSESAARSALGSYVWDAMRQDMQDTRRPWYDQNDNWAQFAGLSSENIAQVQSQMVAMGALEPDDIVFGTWGMTEATQMKTIMTIANGQAEEWTDLDAGMLKEFFDEETTRTTPSRRAFTPEAFRPMDPARVELTVRDSVRALVGRDPTDEDLQVLGGYLTDEYSSAYQADVTAGRAQYDAQIAADDAEAAYGQPGAVEDVDYEARFMQEMDSRFEQQTASQERGVLAGKQQDLGVSMSGLMNRLGGGLG